MEQIANIRHKYLTVLEARIWMVVCLAPNQEVHQRLATPRGLGKSPFFVFLSLGDCGRSLASGHIILLLLTSIYSPFLSC